MVTSELSVKRVLKEAGKAWTDARDAARTGPRVLVATNVTGFQHASMLESVLAIALTLRGAQVELLACDAALPACQKVEPHTIPDPKALVERIDPELCRQCQKMGNMHFAELGLPRRLTSEFITAADRAAARALCGSLDVAQLSTLVTATGDQVGMQGLAGALRYYARGELPDTPEAADVLRRFVEAALLTSAAYDRLLAQHKYDVAVFHHGIYVPQGPAGDALRRHGVRVVNWNPSYRKSTFIFSEGDSYHYTLMDEPISSWADMAWSPAREEEILSYLASRAQGTRDWIWFFEKPEHDGAGFLTQFGLDPAKPIIGMLSNVAWDAQLHFPANAFGNIFDWVYATIDHFAARPDLQLLLRIHPAEIRGTVPSQQLMAEEIARRYPTLPANVFIIRPESPVSTYAVLKYCSAAIIYGTKMGVELTAVGKPVIVAGEAWVRNKGLTHDVSSAAEFERALAKLPDIEPMSPDQIERARKYAYHFFFRRMLPLPFIVPSDKKIYALALEGLDSLRPGAFPGLDVICDGIMHNTPFIYEAERLGLHA
jgi:hypothetical protein